MKRCGGSRRRKTRWCDAESQTALTTAIIVASIVIGIGIGVGIVVVAVVACSLPLTP